MLLMVDNKWARLLAYLQRAGSDPRRDLTGSVAGMGPLKVSEAQKTVSPKSRFPPPLSFFPLHFQSSLAPKVGIVPAPMLTSNRIYADTSKILRPLPLPRLPPHRPTRHPLHYRRRVRLPHRSRPILRISQLRMRLPDRPVCVTKLPAIPATQSRE